MGVLENLYICRPLDKKMTYFNKLIINQQKRARKNN